MNMSEQTQIKHWQTELKKFESEEKILQTQQVELKKQLQDRQSKIQSLKTRINNARQKDVEISEHAILRYLERVTGLPMDTIKEAILPENVRDLVKMTGNGKYPVGSHTVVVKGNSVVTVEI